MQKKGMGKPAGQPSGGETGAKGTSMMHGEAEMKAMHEKMGFEQHGAQDHKNMPMHGRMPK